MAEPKHWLVPIRSGHARGGDDALSAQVPASALTSGETFTLNMYGDAGGNISNGAVAGNDTLDAGETMSGQARGGDDNFGVSGGGKQTVTVYGDAGGNMFNYAGATCSVRKWLQRSH